MFLQSRREYNRPLYVLHVDSKSAFDIVDRSALWILLACIGLPPYVIYLFVALYADAT